MATMSALITKAKRMATPKNILIGGVVLVGGYLIYTRLLKGGVASQIEDNHPQFTPSKKYSEKVVINIKPEGVVPSGAYMMLSGSFLGKNNEVVTVPMGYYYIFRDTGLETGYQFVYAGNLGNNVSNFNINVPTTFFQAGSYEVVVSDEPIPDYVLGSGQFANPAYQGETTYKENRNTLRNQITGFTPAPQFPLPDRVFPGDMPPQQLSQDLLFQ